MSAPRDRLGLAAVLGFLTRRCEVCWWLGAACVWAVEDAQLKRLRPEAPVVSVMLCGPCARRRKAA